MIFKIFRGFNNFHNFYFLIVGAVRGIEPHPILFKDCQQNGGKKKLERQF